MESVPRKNSKTKVAVVGVGYWGKNLVRNFYDLGALAVLCDAEESVEAKCTQQYPGVRFYREFSAVLSDPSVTAVALATPAVTHYEMAKAAIGSREGCSRREATCYRCEARRGTRPPGRCERQNSDGRSHPPISPGNPEAAATHS